MGQVESGASIEDEDLYGDSVLHKDLSLEGVAAAIKRGDIRKICVLSGAGISVSAGIPDFRTPGSGLYYNLEDYDLPSPELLFDLQYFINNPEKYYSFYLVRQMGCCSRIEESEKSIPTNVHTCLYPSSSG